jgi:hypothetical protein
MMNSILTLDSGNYPRHSIHSENRIWAETNCYTDVWIELLHAWGFDPVAALPFALAIDFEGDQWTFFKYPQESLSTLYGLDVQELAIWRPLVQHVQEQVAQGRPVLVELDSYFLPDTAGTAYRSEHVKSTVAVVAIDVFEQRLGYFHNQGYYELAGADFSQVFRLSEQDPAILPPYVEFVKKRDTALHGNDLVQASEQLLRRQLRKMPAEDPFAKFKVRFEADLDWLTTAGLETFHLYSFATLRQFGACYELAATYLHWLQERTGQELEKPKGAFLQMATGAKTLQFQLARAIARKKPLDLSLLKIMQVEWQSALEWLQLRYA